MEVPQPETVSALAFSPDAKRLATAGGWGTALRLWDLATFQLLVTLEHPPEEVVTLDFSRDGNLLGSINANAEVRFWRAVPLPGLQGKRQFQSR